MYYLFKGQTSKNGHEPRLKKNLLMRKSTFFKWFYFSKMNQTSFHFLLTKDIDVSDNSVFLTFFSSCMLWFLSICLKICNHYYYYLVLFKFISLAYYTCPRPIYIYIDKLDIGIDTTWLLSISCIKWSSIMKLTVNIKSWFLCPCCLYLQTLYLWYWACFSHEQYNYISVCLCACFIISLKK